MKNKNIVIPVAVIAVATLVCFYAVQKTVESTTPPVTQEVSGTFTPTVSFGK